jgi:tight adherence protein C
MEYAVFAFLVLFLLIASGLLLIFYREELGRRLSAVIAPRSESVSLDREKTAQAIGIFAGYFGKLLPKGEKEQSVVRKRLNLAGYRREWQLDVFLAARVLVPLLCAVVVLLTGAYETNPFITIPVALGVGYLAPDYWLGYRIKARQNTIRLALPDVLDLFVVCLEAGLSLDQAVLRTSEEMRLVHPVMAEELALVMFDVRGGRARVDAWKNLAERTDVDTVRMLVTILVQADQFGTGISKTLRLHADTLRTRRKQRAEELAAKTTVKLVFPLVLFIFPSLFIVTIGPVFIRFTESFPDIHK